MVLRLLLIVFLVMSAQVNAQVAVSSSGGTMTNASGEVSYTVGQPVYAETESPSMMVYHGVQQPYCQPSYDTVQALVCPNSAYTDYNFNISEAVTAIPGNYLFSQTQTNYCGCDSMVTLQLTVKTLAEEADSVAACDSYMWRGVEYSEGLTRLWCIRIWMGATALIGSISP